MRIGNIISLVALLSCFILSGCVVRTYKVTRDRVDQDLNAGNRGYIMGSAPKNLEAKERKTKRSTQVVEIELRPPVKFEKKTGDNLQEQAKTLERFEPAPEYQTQEPAVVKTQVGPEKTLQKYTVQKNDTLQKISQKFYGTTKKWTKIYDSNRDVLKGPNKIYPGQVISIPVYSGETQQEK